MKKLILIIAILFSASIFTACNTSEDPLNEITKNIEEPAGTNGNPTQDNKDKPGGN